MTVVRTAIDAAVREAAPATNYGKIVALAVNGGATGNDRRSFIHFARPFPLGAAVLTAKLRFVTRGAWAGTQLLTAKRITTKWAESTIRWNLQPTVVATNAGTLSVVGAADKQLLEIDVAALMNDVAAGAAYFGFRLELDTNVDRGLHSAEAVDASLRPVLEVTWTVPPDAPTNLAPAGGRGISLAKPILAWLFSDADAGSSQSSSQVQVDDAADFATPEYDSGKIANTTQLWDLAPTAYAGLPADVTRYWRVRVWDDADLVSAYSDPVQIIRRSKGTLSITSPAGATVAELTPPITWSFTVRVQEAYQVILYRVETSGALTELWNTGKVTSLATSVAPPAGLIVSGKSYRALVRIWDNLDRQAIAGDPDYVEATRSFSYVRSGVPAAVTSLTATIVPSTNSPGVQLEWVRAATPDFFCLKIDGVEVLPRIDPADVFVSGTTYRMTYWGAQPRGSHTYEVEAVVAAAGVFEHGDGNATATKTVDPNGIWLIDPDDNAAVRIAGSERQEIDIGESGTTFFIEGSRAPVRITDTVRGYEGEISGYLRGAADRDTFLKLKGRLKPLRLVISDLSIVVELEEVSAPPTALSNDRLFGCSFGFVQVDEYTFDVVGN